MASRSSGGDRRGGRRPGPEPAPGSAPGQAAPRRRFRACGGRCHSPRRGPGRDAHRHGLRRGRGAGHQRWAGAAICREGPATRPSDRASRCRSRAGRVRRRSVACGQSPGGTLLARRPDAGVGPDSRGATAGRPHRRHGHDRCPASRARLPASTGPRAGTAAGNVGQPVRSARHAGRGRGPGAAR